MIESITEETEAQKLVKARRKGGRGAEVMNIDRLPPHEIEMEQGLLGCMLEDPTQVLDDILAKLSKVGGTICYDGRHQTIYGCLDKMRGQMVPIDLITVSQRLKEMKMLEQVGGISYLSQLRRSVPSAANWPYYCDKLLEKFTLRRYIATCTEIVGRIYDFEGDVAALSDQVEKDILKIGEAQTPEFVVPKVGDLANEVINGIQKAWETKGAPTGLTTGFPDLDAATDGLHPAKVYVIAGRPGMGKSTLAQNIAEHVAINLKKAVGIFSLEMPAKSWIERMIASQAKVNIRDMKKHQSLHEGDVPKIMSAVGKVTAAQILIDDTAGLSILQLRARARRMAKTAEAEGNPIALWVVDYLQLMNSTAMTSRDNREREVADISAGLKGMSKELNVPVIVLSQLNRESEKAGGKPKMSQLRESGAIEQDADLIGLLYKPDGEDPETQEEQDLGQPMTFYIDKQRDGDSQVSIHLTFLKPYTRFESAAKFNDEDVPVNLPVPNYMPYSE